MRQEGRCSWSRPTAATRSALTALPISNIGGWEWGATPGHQAPSAENPARHIVPCLGMRAVQLLLPRLGPLLLGPFRTWLRTLGDTLNQLHEMGPNVPVLYLAETFDQPLAQSRSQELDKFIQQMVRGLVALRPGQPLKQRTNRDVQYFGNLLQAAGANAVCPFFV